MGSKSDISFKPQNVTFINNCDIFCQFNLASCGCDLSPFRVLHRRSQLNILFGMSCKCRICLSSRKVFGSRIALFNARL
jgi:hypothetical protein